jgi:hypothetical protein
MNCPFFACVLGSLLDRNCMALEQLLHILPTFSPAAGNWQCGGVCVLAARGCASGLPVWKDMSVCTDVQ